MCNRRQDARFVLSDVDVNLIPGHGARAGRNGECQSLDRHISAGRRATFEQRSCHSLHGGDSALPGLNNRTGPTRAAGLGPCLDSHIQCLWRSASHPHRARSVVDASKAPSSQRNPALWDAPGCKLNHPMREVSRAGTPRCPFACRIWKINN